MVGISILRKETQRAHSSLLLCEDMCGDDVSELGSISHQTLNQMVDFPVSRTLRNECFLFKPPLV